MHIGMSHNIEDQLKNYIGYSKKIATAAFLNDINLKISFHIKDGKYNIIVRRF